MSKPARQLASMISSSILESVKPEDRHNFRVGMVWEQFWAEVQPDGSIVRVPDEPREPLVVTAIDVERGIITMGRKP